MYRLEPYVGRVLTGRAVNKILDKVPTFVYCCLDAHKSGLNIDKRPFSPSIINIRGYWPLARVLSLDSYEFHYPYEYARSASIIDESICYITSDYMIYPNKIYLCDKKESYDLLNTLYVEYILRTGDISILRNHPSINIG